MERTGALVAALAFIALLGGLTLRVVVQEGLDVLTVISLLVLALAASGVVSALRQPPSE